MMKRRFNGKDRKFWNVEYKTANHLALSDKPSEDLVKFTRWLERQYGKTFLNKTGSVLDLGCGNGRNLIYLARTFGVKGVGFDISSEAVAQAKRTSAGLPIEYRTQSIANPLPLAAESQTLALDMMTSHFLNALDRQNLLSEIARVLKPNGWLFLKTFLREEDKHAERLLREHPAGEAGSYIHPKIGLAEHVFTQSEIEKALAGQFIIQKIAKSHGHLRRGAAFKRRSISVYAQKASLRA
ncbi:MAG: class I SAM-dependent methyltransferase [Candidatus Taylorbacteria bacterium]|nr:class I SAM-dependent methyltransferase [Candidatus Taylorbacteria bacterium]